MSHVRVTREAMEKVTTDIFDEVMTIIMEKNYDYGDAWQRHGLAGLLVRISDKALRYENIMGKKHLVVDESARDTLVDMIGYSILGLLLINSLTEDT